MVKLVAVTGATGNQGGSVARYLLKFPDQYKIRALTRNPESASAKELSRLGAEVVQADLTKPSEIKNAVQGCWGVFGVTNFYDQKIKNDPNSEEQQGKNLANAAAEAGVRCFIWSTLPSSEKLSGGKLISQIYEGKHRVDEHIQDIRLPTVFLFTGNFYENMNLRGHVRYDKEKDQIEFHQPIILPRTKLSMLYVEKDLSGISKAIFDQWESKQEDLKFTYLHASNARLSPTEITSKIQKVSGKPTIYNVLPSTGVPDRDIMFELYNRVGMYPGQEIPDKRVLELGVKLHNVEDYIRETLLPHLGLKSEAGTA